MRATKGMSEGHAVVDAMVALLIIAMTVTLSLRALMQAQLTADRAEEVRAARTLIDDLMLSGPRSLTPMGGATAGFDWTLSTQPTGDVEPVALCRRAVALVGQTSARKYGAATISVCPGA